MMPGLNLNVFIHYLFSDTILVLVLFVALVAMSVSAQSIQLGNFPVGQWLDQNYNAIWEFSPNNIRILYPNGVVAHDFSNYTIQNFRVFMEGTAPGISFTCPDTGRSYRFIKPLTSGDLVMEIEREGLPSYSVTQQTWTGVLPPPPARPAAASGGLPTAIYSDENYRMSYEFSGNTWKLLERDQHGDIERVSGTYTARNGLLTMSRIDVEGELVSDEYKYTLVGNKLTLTDVNGYVTEYTKR